MSPKPSLTQFAKSVHYALTGNNILQGITETFSDNQIIALLGRSGSGKTTLLRVVAGLEKPSAGAIVLNDKVLVDKASEIFIPPEKRQLGLVFQSYALWPHKTVFENVAYGLKLRGVDKNDCQNKTASILESVGLGDLGHRYPNQLSGGQQQRVALARAIVYSPPLILLDEPLSNLDAKLREEARIWIRRLIKEIGQTAIFVTHDQMEAMAIADEIILLEQGKVIQRGTPQNLYNQPCNLFAAQFMGTNNLLEVSIQGSNGQYAALQLEDFILNGVTIGEQKGQAADRFTQALIRVEEVQIVDGPGDNHIKARLDTSLYLGGCFEHVFKVGKTILRANSKKQLDNGDYWLMLPRAKLWVF